MKKTAVAILGATGTVGQKAIAMLASHPLFEITELVASDKRAGHAYGDCCEWREDLPCPAGIAEKAMIAAKDITSPYVISSIPATQARELEMELATRGHHILSNASAFRMAEDVPLLIPDINSEHVELIFKQKTKGKIICNPNCSTVFLAMGLAPLLELDPLVEVSAFTMQAVSGAGYPGVPSIDIIGNSIPFISNEEDKIENESQKILGKAGTAASFQVMAHVNRVAVSHGHCVTLHAKTTKSLKLDDVVNHYKARGESNPEVYKYHSDNFRPQVRLDINSDDMRAHIGRIKVDSENKRVGLLSIGHNLVRGAAGAAIANMELLHERLSKENS